MMAIRMLARLPTLPPVHCTVLFACIHRCHACTQILYQGVRQYVYYVPPGAHKHHEEAPRSIQL